MAKYKMIGTDDLPGEDRETVVATHPAPVGTYVIYAFKDGSHHKAPVVLWGVLQNGVAVPITLCGVWDGAANRNRFILHPDGSCSDSDTSWECLSDAVDEMMVHDSGE